MTDYVHGYSPRETERLFDQAGSVKTLLHHDTSYAPGSRVLEAGCGVAAQTVTLARNSPGAHFVSFDIDPDSLEKAEALVRTEGITNVAFQQADVHALPFEAESFDHVFVCYLLEHLKDPAGVLAALSRVLKERGSITVIEGDHGSCNWSPETEAARRAWNCLIEVQAALGGDSLIGRRLFPLVTQAGFDDVSVSPRFVYGDHSLPDLVESFWSKTIIPMVAGVREQAIEQGRIDVATWEEGLRDLHRVIESDAGTFTYTFFKAVAFKPTAQTGE